MYNIEEAFCAATIKSVLAANLQLMHTTAEEAVGLIARHTPDKHDALGLDGIPEATIEATLRAFDRSAVLITEEIGASSSNWILSRPSSIFVSDPTDRSAQLKQFLEAQDKQKKIGDIVEGSGAISEWEEKFGAPASITGATSAITCVRHGIPINSVFVNFITQELFVAYRGGIYSLKLPNYGNLEPDQISLEYIRSNGRTIFFRQFKHMGADMVNMRFFVTFLGKTGYADNFRDSNLIKPEDAKKYLRYDLPGGPSRVLYLSTVEPNELPVGFILANGEKIGEWIHWLPFVQFGRVEGEQIEYALNLYEIHQERPWTKEGILMSTPTPYSIFLTADGHQGRQTLNLDKLEYFSNPSRFRSTLLVAPVTNTWAMTVMETHLNRQIRFAD